MNRPSTLKQSIYIIKYINRKEGKCVGHCHELSNFRPVQENEEIQAQHLPIRTKGMDFICLQKNLNKNHLRFPLLQSKSFELFL